jgi:hypothetical protein
MSVLMCSRAANVTWVGILYGMVNVLGLMFEHCVNHMVSFVGYGTVVRC